MSKKRRRDVKCHTCGGADAQIQVCERKGVQVIKSFRICGPCLENWRQAQKAGAASLKIGTKSH